MGKTPSDQLRAVARLSPQTSLYKVEALSDQLNCPQQDQQHGEFVRELGKSSIPGREAQQGFRSHEVLFLVVFISEDFKTNN
jgi:hypothetical protein